jgi:hypothetical protein
MTFLEYGRYEKTLETQGVGAGTQAVEPIRSDLVDPTSTAFED